MTDPEFIDDDLTLVLAGSEELRLVVAKLIGDYERAVGVLDNLIDFRLDLLGSGMAKVLRKRLFPARLHDAERFELLDAILIDLAIDAPTNAIIRVFKDVKTLRDKAAHAADYMIRPSETGPVAEFLPLIRRNRANVRTVVPLDELDAHLARLDWVIEWLQHIEMTHPAYDTGSQWQQLWRTVNRTPPEEPPALPSP